MLIPNFRMSHNNSVSRVFLFERRSIMTGVQCKAITNKRVVLLRYESRKNPILLSVSQFITHPGARVNQPGTGLGCMCPHSHWIDNGCYTTLRAISKSKVFAHWRKSLNIYQWVMIYHKHRTQGGMGQILISLQTPPSWANTHFIRAN